MRHLLVIRIGLPAWLGRLGVGLVLLYRRLRFGSAFRRIPLTQGLYALVDGADYPALVQHKWHATRGRHTWYAQRKIWDADAKKEITIKMHRVILAVPPGYVVDHINRNGLDNRPVNLRPATPAQNACNRLRAGRPRRHSRHRGVTWHKGMRKWFARIGVRGETLPLGYYDDDDEAARAYDAAARVHHGEFAVLNFP